MKEPEGHLPGLPTRASDAERDRAEERLKHHYAVGRLTLTELEERVGAAYGARTREQLQSLLADLPAEVAESTRSAPVIDSRLLIILLCCSPPAALVYWIAFRLRERRRGALARAPESGDGAGPPGEARHDPPPLPTT
ncbi:DUF1707 domain-containing protein [Streptomyces sp. NPDC008125]|uniref:DUF1707 SHOCT-like domain-containing protein n=1 Tax=Streptomyces sp. NPDC008125 TaxID=3364811 RepID=UPI0036F0E9CD